MNRSSNVLQPICCDCWPYITIYMPQYFTIYCLHYFFIEPHLVFIDLNQMRMNISGVPLLLQLMLTLMAYVLGLLANTSLIVRTSRLFPPDMSKPSYKFTQTVCMCVYVCPFECVCAFLCALSFVQNDGPVQLSRQWSINNQPRLKLNYRVGFFTRRSA